MGLADFLDDRARCASRCLSCQSIEFINEAIEEARELLPRRISVRGFHSYLVRTHGPEAIPTLTAFKNHLERHQPEVLDVLG